MEKEVEKDHLLRLDYASVSPSNLLGDKNKKIREFCYSLGKKKDVFSLDVWNNHAFIKQLVYFFLWIL